MPLQGSNFQEIAALQEMGATLHRHKLGGTVLVQECERRAFVFNQGCEHQVHLDSVRHPQPAAGDKNKARAGADGVRDPDQQLLSEECSELAVRVLPDDHGALHLAGARVIYWVISSYHINA